MPTSDVQTLEDTLVTDQGTAPQTATPAGAESSRASGQDAAQSRSQVATPAQSQAGAAAPAAGGSPPSLPPALLERARGAGLKLDGITSHEKLNDYLLDQYLQSRPYADYGRQSLAQPRNPASQQSNPEAGREQDKAPDQEAFDLDGHFKGLWSAPQLDAASQYAIQNGMVQLSDNGLYEAAPGLESLALPLLQNLNQTHISQKQQMQKLFEGNFYKNVYDAILPALRHSLSDDFTNLSQESVKTYEQDSMVEKFRDQNKDWLYTPDGTAFTEQGQKFSQQVDDLVQNGLPLPKAIAIAQLVVPKPAAAGGAPPNTPPVATGAPPAGEGEKQRDEQGRFLKAGTPSPAPKSKQETFIDDARRKASASGTQGGYAAAGGDLVLDGDPENIWTQAWNQHTGGVAVK